MNDKYRLQREESSLTSDSSVNHISSWEDIEVSEDLEKLKKNLPHSENYRIVSVFNEGGLESKLF